MIDTSKIAGAIHHKVVAAELFDYYEIPNFSNPAQKTGTWLEAKPILPLNEGMASNVSETGIYILDYVVYVPIGTGDTILDQKQLALGELLNPLTAGNGLFNIFRVERLGNANYNKNWRQGTVRISIRTFKR